MVGKNNYVPFNKHFQKIPQTNLFYKLLKYINPLEGKQMSSPSPLFRRLINMSPKLETSSLPPNGNTVVPQNVV